MNQILHIFRKDVRRHWPEIAASFALVVAFGWKEIRGWQHRGIPDFLIFGPLSFFVDLIPLLLTVSWIFLIVRVVHGESLVGDRQFWVTRPYEWPRLLVGKVLFVLTFVNLPLFLLDIVLLAWAGFHPGSYISGLLTLQLLWICLFLVIAALAAVTSGIGQMLLALLFVALYATALSSLTEAIPNSSAPVGSGAISALLGILTAAAVILAQYSLRITARSRWLIAGLGVAIAVIMVATPYRALIAREYPSSTRVPLLLTLTPSQPHPSEAATQQQNQPVFIRLNFSLSGIPNDSFVRLDGAILTLTNATGQRWDSGWGGYNLLLFPDMKTTFLSFDLKRTDFDRMKSSPVRAHLFLGFTLFHDQNQRPFVIPAGEFAMPELGFCSARTSGFSNQFSCRIALQRPASLLLTSDMGASPCSLGEGVTRPAPGEIAREFLHDKGVDLGISPVEVLQVYLSSPRLNNPRTNPGLCPGSALVLSSPQSMGRGRMELQVDNLNLEDYRLKSQGNDGDGTGIIVGVHVH